MNSRFIDAERGACVRVLVIHNSPLVDHNEFPREVQVLEATAESIAEWAQQLADRHDPASKPCMVEMDVISEADWEEIQGLHDDEDDEEEDEDE